MTTSRTEEIPRGSEFAHQVDLAYTWRCIITDDDGKDFIGMGYSPEEAQEKASEEYQEYHGTVPDL